MNPVNESKNVGIGHLQLGALLREVSPQACAPAYFATAHFSSPAAAASTALQKIGHLVQSSRFDAARREIERGRRKELISEFHELNLLQAIEAMEACRALAELAELRQASEWGDDEDLRARAVELEERFEDHHGAAEAFLEGALASARDEPERMVVQENRAALALMRGDAVAAATICADLLVVRQTETLWTNLLIALDRLGETSIVDDLLGVIGRSGPDHMLRMLAEDRDLTNLHSRPAFQECIRSRLY